MKSMRRFRSLRVKILLPLVAVGLVAAGTGLWLTRWYVGQQHQEQAMRRAEAIVHAVNNAAETFRHLDELQRFVSAMGAEADVNLIVVTGGEPAKVIACTRHAWVGLGAGELAVGVAVDVPAVSVEGQTLFCPVSHQYFLTSPMLRSSADPSVEWFSQGTVTVVLDAVPIERQVSRAAWVGGLFVLGLVLAVTGVSYALLSYHVVGPARAITRAVARRAGGDAWSWAPAKSMDEIGRLATTLNETLEKLDHQQESLRQKTSRLELLHRISEAVNVDTPVDQILSHAMLMLYEHYPQYRFSYRTVDPLSHTRVAHVFGPPGMPDIMGIERDMNTAPEWLGTIRRYEPMVVEDVERDGRLGPLGPVFFSKGSRALLDTPVRHSDQLVGLISCNSPVTRRWTEDEITTFHEAAELLSVTLKEAYAQERRAAAEAALKISEERFKLAVAGSQDGLWDWDVTTGKTWFSPRYKEQLGYGVDELEERYESWESRLHPEDRQGTLAALGKHFEDDSVYDVEFRLRAKSGEYRWIRSRGCTLRDGDGRPVRMAGSHQDITDRKQAEESLSQTNQFLDSLIEHIPHMIFVKEAGELRFVRFNRAGERLLGYSREEMLGKNDFDFFPPEQARFFTGKDREVLGVSEAREIVREPVQTRSGGLRWLRTIKVPLFDGQGRAKFLLGISEDITEKIRTEALLEQTNRQLKAKNEELQQFLYTLPHDLKAPLVTIRGFTSLLRESLAPVLSPKQGLDLQRIAQAAERMDCVIDDVLEYNRLGHLEQRPQWVCVKELLDQIKADLAGWVAQRNARVVVSPGLPEAYGDADSLWQLFENLLTNALKYGCEGLSEPVIEVGGWVEREGRLFFVRDQGPGITSAYHHSIFDLFRRVATPKHGADGSGIGLAIVKKIVEIHNGRVWVESQAGEGATFWVWLPNPRGELETGGDDGALYAGSGV